MSDTRASALIFADRLGQELSPLFQDLGPALLPLAQKTPLHYCLDDLAEAGVRHAVVVVSHAAEQVQQLLSQGEPWGMQLEVVLSRGEEPPSSLLRRFRSLLQPRFLAIRGDVLRSAMVKEMMAACSDQSTTAASLNGRSLGLAYVDEQEDTLAALAWPLPPCEGLEMDGHRFSPLESLLDVLQANLDLAGGGYLGLVTAGLSTQDGVMRGRLSHLDAASVVDPPVSLGDHSSVHRSARLYGPVVIGENCFVDRETQVRDSLILPNTYIGAGLDVKDAIVGEGLLIHPQQGLSLPIDDPLWVASMGSATQTVHAPWTERVLALLLLLASLPLWPLAALLALPSDAAIWQQRVLLGNRRDVRGQRQEFTLYSFAAAVPWLGALPGLAAVVTGHLRLFGAPAAKLGYARDLPVRFDAPPAGLIAASTLELERDAPSEEVELFEVCFAAERSWRRELRCWWLALRALFSRRAWVQG